MLNFGEFIKVFVFTTNHHLNRRKLTATEVFKIITVIRYLLHIFRTQLSQCKLHWPFGKEANFASTLLKFGIRYV